MSPNTKDDAQQIECVNNAVAGGYQAIIVAANGPDAISSALKEAKDAGIKIVYVDSPANVEAEATFSTDNEAAGTTAGNEMLKALKDAGVTSGKIGIVNVNAATDSTVKREAGFRKAFEGTDFELMETQYGEGDAAKSQTIAENYITQGVVGIFGWQWGFVGSSVAGVLGVAVIVFLLHDTPESKGLPPIEVLTGEESPGQSHDHGSTSDLQRSVIRNPFVWVLALSSAFMYVSRYAVNGWGVLFLQEVKGYSLALATQVISVNALLGIVGTVFSGWLSDTLFHGRRNVLAFGFGVLNTVALCLFLYSGDGILVNMLSMVLFGMAIGVLICFLGGLMAVDIVPRKATGAALGVVGIASYCAAGIQDVASGWLIDKHITVAADGVKHYDFGPVAFFWIAASVISFILPLLNRRRSE